MTDEEKAKQIGNLQLWKVNNPDKMQATESRRLQKKKAARKDREFVAVDLEGFDTGKYYTMIGVILSANSMKELRTD